MKVIFITSLIFINLALTSAQNQEAVEAFGMQMFSAIKNFDTSGLKMYLPSKQDLLDYIETSTMTNEAKKNFLKDIDEGLVQMNKELNPNVLKISKRGVSEGIDWSKTKYLSTEIIYWTKPGETSFKPIEISINFTYFSIRYSISTMCIIVRKRTLLVEKFAWQTK